MIEFKDLVSNANYIANGQVFKMDMKMMFAFCGGTSPYLLQNIEPIPLTPDILEKCGFVKVPNVRSEYFFANFNIRFKSDVYSVYKHIGETFGLLTSIRYLHQLQNLYHTLTQTNLHYIP